MDPKIKVCLELSRHQFNGIKSKVSKIESHASGEMEVTQTRCLLLIGQINELITEKIDQGASSVEQIRTKINKWNDEVTDEINNLKDLNEHFCSRKESKKNTTRLNKARKMSQSIDNRIQRTLKEIQHRS